MHALKHAVFLSLSIVWGGVGCVALPHHAHRRVRRGAPRQGELLRVLCDIEMLAEADKSQNFASDAAMPQS